jgi:hypothetical protein
VTLVVGGEAGVFTDFYHVGYRYWGIKKPYKNECEKPNDFGVF